MSFENNKVNDRLKSHSLRRDLGFLEAAALVVGMVIGSGVFFKPAIVFSNAGTLKAGIAAWLVGGIITMAAGLTVAEIAVAIPETGGLLVYLKKLYGDKWAFLLGWVQTLVYIPGSVAALAIVFATQASFFISMTRFQQMILAMIMITIVTVVNIISTKFGGKLQILFTIAKLIPIFIIVIFGFIKGSIGEASVGINNVTNISGFGAAVLGTLWAYDGWISVGNIAGELKNPKRDLPMSIISGLLLVIIVYVLINLAVTGIVDLNAIKASEKPVSDAAVVLFGKPGAALISAGILISIFGTLNGYLLTGARVPLAMGQHRMSPFSDFFSKVGKNGTPVNSLIFEGVLAILYTTTGTFNTLTDLVIFVLWIFFTMTVAGVFILRKKHTYASADYKVPLYPIVPLIGIIGGLFILTNTLFTNTYNALYGIGVTILGLPVYVYLKRKNMF